MKRAILPFIAIPLVISGCNINGLDSNTITKYINLVNKIPNSTNIINSNRSSSKKMKEMESSSDGYKAYNPLMMIELSFLDVYDDYLDHIKSIEKRKSTTSLVENSWFEEKNTSYHFQFDDDKLIIKTITKEYYQCLNISYDDNKKAVVSGETIYPIKDTYGRLNNFYTRINFIEDEYVEMDYYSFLLMEAGETSKGGDAAPERRYYHNYHIYSDLEQKNNITYIVKDYTEKTEDNSFYQDFGGEAKRVEKVGDYYVASRTIANGYNKDKDEYGKPSTIHYVYNKDGYQLMEIFNDEESDGYYDIGINTYECISGWSKLRYDTQKTAGYGFYTELLVGDTWVNGDNYPYYSLCVIEDNNCNYEIPWFRCRKKDLNEILNSLSLQYTLSNTPAEIRSTAIEQFSQKKVFGFSYEELINLKSYDYEEFFKVNPETYENAILQKK